jgi:ribose transport system substrate-binding protein
MKRRTLVVLGLTLIFLASMFAGCASAAAPAASAASSAAQGGGDKLTFGVVCQALNSEYWHGFAQGAREGAEQVGVNVTINGPIDETKVAEQIAMIEDMITNKVDALLVAANQPKSIMPTFENAKKAGIPVMEVDVEDGWEGRVCYVGAGNYKGGEEAGKWFLNNLPAGSEIAIVRGAMGDPTHDLRAGGGKDVMGDKLKIVSTQPADSLRDKAVGVMENILTANPNIKGVFATNDEMALGALKAIQARKLDIKVIGFDGNMEALLSVKDKGLAATVSCVGYDISKLAVITMKEFLDGTKKLESKDQVFVPPTAVDATLVDKFIEAGKELAEKIKKNTQS